MQRWGEFKEREKMKERRKTVRDLIFIYSRNTGRGSGKDVRAYTVSAKG